MWVSSVFLGGQPRPHPKNGAHRPQPFWGRQHAGTEYEKQQPNFACTVIKLYVRKIFTRSTTSADARSVCDS